VRSYESTTLFLTLNVFLVTTITGSFFQIAQQIIEEPSSLTNLLAASLPKQSLFFVNYVINQTFITYSIFWLLRLPDYAICKFMQWCVAKTKQEKLDATKPDPPFQYHIHYGRELLILQIVLTYSVMSPIILPFGVLFFMFAYWTAKYNFLYVYSPPYDGVRMSHTVVDSIFGALIIFHLTMIGLFSANNFAAGVIAMILLIVLSIGFRVYLGQRFYAPSKYLPLERCPKPYGKEKSRLTEPLRIFDYVHPALHPLKSMRSDGTEFDQISINIKDQQLDDGSASNVSDNSQHASMVSTTSSTNTPSPFYGYGDYRYGTTVDGEVDR